MKTRTPLLLGIITVLSLIAVMAATTVNGPTSTLTVTDLSETQTIYINSTTEFYANFTNTTSGATINASNVTCTISLNSTGTWSALSNLTFNTTSLLYEYNATINVTGTYYANVTCNGTALNEDYLSLLHPFTINNSKPSAPEHLTYTFGANYWWNISCGDATDLENSTLYYDLFFNNSGTVEYLNSTNSRNLSNNQSYIWNITNLLGNTILSQETKIFCQSFDNESYSEQSRFQTIKLSRRPDYIGPDTNYTIWEDFYTTINISGLFNDSDGDDINYTINPGTGLSGSINNNTGVLNVTTTKDYYGSSNFTITATDDKGYNITSNISYVTILDTPDVILRSPLNASNSSTYTDDIRFRALINNTYGIVNCTLYLNNTANQTVFNPVLGDLQEINVSDGTREGQSNKVGPSNTLMKRLNATGTIYQIKIHLYMGDNGPDNPYLEVTVNNGTAKNHTYNITKTDIYAQIPTDDTWGWFDLDVENEYFYINELNNITFTSTIDEIPDFIRIGTDTNTNAGLSFDNGAVQAFEYMVRLANMSNVVTFNATNVKKGSWNWDALCYNNQTYSYAEQSYTLTILNTKPTMPTQILPASGTYDGEINLSCLGSTDLDPEDNLTYTFYYQRIAQNDYTTIISSYNSENYTWDTTSQPTNFSYKIKCNSNDGTEDSSEYWHSGYPIKIYHPNASTVPTNLTCDGVVCNSTDITNDIINLSCYGSGGNNNFTYYFRAKYNDYDGTKWRSVGNVSGMSSGATGNLTYNTTSIYNQTNVSFSCYAGGGVHLDSEPYNVTGVNITHPYSPPTPTVLTPATITADYNISINCSGSGNNALYRIYAQYDDTWTLINNSFNDSSLMHWNFSDVFEQDIDLKCQSYNQSYKSPFLNPPGLITVNRIPTTPTNLSPASGNYEYEINYSCSGANNSDYFLHQIEANYDNGTVKKWFNLTTQFPGISPVNETKLKWEDRNLDTQTTSAAPSWNYYYFSINLTNATYNYCILANGTSGSQYRLGWNCSGTDCEGKYPSQTTYNSFTSTSLTTYCTNITLSVSKLTKFLIETYSANSVHTSSIDRAYLTAYPFQWNVTSINRQPNVSLRCLAYDSAGSSSYSPLSNITINRIPIFNSSKTASWSDTGSILKTKNMSDYFSDVDNDTLNYTVASDGGASVSLTNETAVFSSNSVGSYTIIINADDNISSTNGTFTLVVNANPGSGGGSSGGGGGVAATPGVSPAPAPKPVSKPKSAPEGGGREVSKNLPVEEIYTGELLFNHSRITRILVGGRTEVTEFIENTAEFTQSNISVRLNFSKEIAPYYTDIYVVSKNIPNGVVVKDPVLEFNFTKFDRLTTNKIQYTIPGSYDEEYLKDKILVRIIAERYNETEILRKTQEELAKESGIIVNITRTFTNTTYEEKTSFYIPNISIDITAEIKLNDCSLSSGMPDIRTSMVKGRLICSQPVDFIDERTARLVKSWRTGLNIFSCNYTKAEETRCANSSETFSTVFREGSQISKEVDKNRLLGFEIWWFLIPVILVLTYLVLPSQDGSQKHKIAKIIWSIMVLLLFIMYLSAFFKKLSPDLGFMKNTVSLTLALALILKLDMWSIFTGMTKTNKQLRILFNTLIVLSVFFSFIPRVIDEQALMLDKMFILPNLLTWMLTILPPGMGIEQTLTTIAVSILLLIFTVLFLTNLKGQGSIAVLGVRNWIFQKDIRLWPVALFRRLTAIPVLILFYLLSFHISIYIIAWALDSEIVILLFIILIIFHLWNERHNIKYARFGKFFKDLKDSIMHAVTDSDKYSAQLFTYSRFVRSISLTLLFMVMLYPLQILIVYILPSFFIGSLPGMYGELLNTEYHLPFWNVPGKGLFAVLLASVNLISAVGLTMLILIALFISIHIFTNRWKKHKKSNKIKLKKIVYTTASIGLIAFVFAPFYNITLSNAALSPGADLQTQTVAASFEPTLIGRTISIIILLFVAITIIRLINKEIKIQNRFREFFALTCLGLPFLYYILKLLLPIPYSIWLVIPFSILAGIGSRLLHGSEHFDYVLEWLSIIVIGFISYINITDHTHKLKILTHTIRAYYEGSLLTLITVNFNSIMAIALGLFIIIVFWFGLIRELAAQSELGLYPHLSILKITKKTVQWILTNIIPILRIGPLKNILLKTSSRLIHKSKKFIQSLQYLTSLRFLLLIPKPYLISNNESIRNETELKQEIQKELAKNEIPEETIGELAEKDIPLNTIQKEIEKVKDNNKKEQLTQELDKRYEESIQFELTHDKNPEKILKELKRYNLTTKELTQKIEKSQLSLQLKKKIKFKLEYKTLHKPALDIPAKKYIDHNERQKTLNKELYLAYQDTHQITQIKDKILEKGWTQQNYKNALEYVKEQIKNYVKKETEKGHSLKTIGKHLIENKGYDTELTEKAIIEYIRENDK